MTTVGCLSRLKFRAWILFWTSDLQCVVCQHYGDFSKGFIYTNAEPTINSSPLRHLFSIQGTTRSESPCSASKLIIEISKGLAKLCGTQVGNHWRLWGLTQMLDYSHTHSCPTTLSGVRVPMPTVRSVCVAILVANVVFSNIHRYSESLLVLLLSHRSAVLEGKEIQTDLNQKLELPLK